MKKCKADDLKKIQAFYQLVCRETKNITTYARWVYGKHPSDSLLESYVSRGAMYYLEYGPDITAAVAVTPFQPEEYHGIDWQAELEDDEVAVAHLLAVNPRYQKRGYARAIMEEAIDFSKRTGFKAVRLDALESNTPAHSLYESLGFLKRDKRLWYAENTGWINFYLFEKLL